MHSAIPLTRDLVLVGGGHAHALVLRAWGMKPLPGVRLTLINPGPTAPYSGMLPGFVAGHYSRDQLDIDLVRLARFAGARWIDGRAEGIDRKAGSIHVSGRVPVAYDVAALDIGITSDLPAVKGFARYAVPAKPLGAFSKRWDAFATTPDPGPVVVLGGGVAGCELAMACAHRLGGGASVSVIDRNRVLGELPEATRSSLLKAMDGLGITLMEKTQVGEVLADSVVLSGGGRVEAALVIGVAGARPQDWLSGTGLCLHDGFVTVDRHLRSSDPAVFAAGDCAHLGFDPRPKAGVFAVRQAPVLFHNTRTVLGTGNLRAFRPQRDYLKLISLGEKRALGDKAGLRFTGRLGWSLKDRIDRRFMAKFRDYPRMKAAPLPDDAAQGVREIMAQKPLCGGCGAKVGAPALLCGLQSLPAPRRRDVLSLAGDDAAVLAAGAGVQVLTTDHLRAVTEDPFQMARITACHALGDIWATGAEPQAVLSTIILPRMSARMQADTLREITAGAASIFTALGADMVGGHTTLGAELTIGFTITGLARAARAQSGAQPGDQVILTRPVGSGVLLAAEMQGDARGADIADLITTMTSPQDAAAAVLAPRAHAMTDVTGFGLAGHLHRVCVASGVGAVLWPQRVPLYRGALDLAGAGHRSSIWPANVDSVPGLDPHGARQDLMFDPQTCGGLLAAVPEAAVAELLASVPGAAHVGEITKAPGLAFR